jgi:pyocin large subunit-like protein
VRSLFKLLLFTAAAAFLFYLLQGGNGPAKSDRKTSKARSSSLSAAPRATQTWGNPASLPDHFARHGADFGARNAEDYARMASQFLQRAKAEGLPAKIDGSVMRVFDYRSGTFGVYNRDGTTKTFFKPGNRDYFERQPGQSVNLRTWR